MLVMKKIVTTAIMLGMITAAWAATGPMVFHTVGKSIEYNVGESPKLLSESRQAFPMKSNPFKLEQEQEVTVNVKVICPEGLELNYVSYGNYWLQSTWWEEENEFEWPIWSKHPMNPNVAYALFTPKDGTAACKDLYIVFTEFESLEEGMTLEFDATKATEKYEFEMRGPDGKPFEFATLGKNEEGETIVVEQGEIQQGLCFVEIGHESGNAIGSWDQFMYKAKEDDGSYVGEWKPRSLYIGNMPASVSVSFSASLCSTDDDHSVYMLNTGSLTNAGLHWNRSDFVEHAESFVPTCDVMLTEQAGVSSGLYNSANGYIWSGCGTTIDVDVDEGETISQKYYYSVASRTDRNIYEPVFPCELVNQDESLELNGSSILAMPFRIRLGMAEYLPLNVTMDGSANQLGSYFQYNYDDPLFPFSSIDNSCNPFVDSNPRHYIRPKGGNVPTLTWQCLWPEEMGAIPAENLNDILVNYPARGYVGRWGEVRLNDQKIVAEQPSILLDEENGIAVYDIKSNNTMISNDITGVNHTTMTVCYRKADWVPPTLQLLTMHNEAGQRTELFKSPSDGTIEFYAGDFYYEIDESRTENQISVRPMESVKVEYAPRGSEDFTEIEVSEDPAKYFWPGYGYYFSGSLKGVTKGSADGWFDLRITLADETGNTQTQLISPAFHVESNLGVDAIAETRRSVRVEGRDIIAPAGSVAYTLAGVPTHLTGLTPGVYLVKTPIATVKCVVR